MRLFINLLLNIDRILACLAGAVWALQGLGFLPGKLMSGHIMWTYIGVGMIVVAGGLMFGTLRRMKG
jgi:hypothetical protein